MDAMTLPDEIEPEILLPVQLANPRADVPERRLVRAVLEDALDVFRKHVRTGQAPGLFAEVEEWFASDDTGWPFAFVNVCDVLGIDAAWLRSRLRHWEASHPESRADGLPVVRLRRAGDVRHPTMGHAAGIRRSA
jgi:hypothetical protein